jgi:ABC-type nitrate/sulfonate/bicarbonate transport system ATPase subunit/ABC-type nitrate/sulfonate/bicarbonate transport system permease component
MRSHAILQSRMVRVVLAIFMLVFTLEVLSRLYGLPTTTDVLHAGHRLARSGTLAQDIAVSLTRWGLGFFPGTVFGIALGLLTGRLRFAALVLEGFLILLRGVPFIALLPLTLFIFGIAESGKAFLIAWVSFVTSWLIVHIGATQLSERIVWKLQVLGTPTWRKMLRVVVPSLSPHIYAAVRNSVSYALIAVAVAEMSGIKERSSGQWLSEGLGYRIFRAYEVTDLDAMMAAIVIFGLLAVALDRLFILLWEAGAKVRTRLVEGRAHRAIASVGMAVRAEQNGMRKLSVQRLSASQGGRPVVMSVSFAVSAGETLVVVGPSGCGKTTLLRAIAGFASDGFSREGEVRLGAEVLDGPCERIGVVFQDASVFGHMSAWDNALFGIESPSNADRRRIKGMFKRFGLLQDAHRIADTFSGGQRQRLAVACALAYRPQLLLLDEPFGALDTITRRAMQEFFFEEIKGSLTCVFVTHDIGEAVLLADTVRVGVSSDAPVFRTSSNEKPETREFTPQFGVEKRKVAEAIRAEYERST